VTHHLKTGTVDKATDHKQALEQRQREEAKDRKERGVKWETKVNNTYIIESITVL